MHSWVRKLSQSSLLKDVSNENEIFWIPSEALEGFWLPPPGLFVTGRAEGELR